MAVVVLFTCAGQRVDIVTAFARAGATTLAADVNELAPALYAAERRAIVPRVDDPGYVEALRALVEEHDVRLIVPLADLDDGAMHTPQRVAVDDGDDDGSGRLRLRLRVRRWRRRDVPNRCSRAAARGDHREQHKWQPPHSWLGTASSSTSVSMPPLSSSRICQK